MSHYNQMRLRKEATAWKPTKGFSASPLFPLFTHWPLLLLLPPPLLPWVYSWTLMLRSCCAAPCLLHQPFSCPGPVCCRLLAGICAGAGIPTQQASVHLCPADNPLQWEAGLLLQMSSRSEILSREGPVRAGLRGKHPVHCRVSGVAVQGRISWTVF